MKKFKKDKKVKQNRFEEILEIPREVSSGIPKLTIVGFENLLIENYKSILEYQEFFIRLSTSIGIININGFDMKLEEMTNDDILVLGQIDSIDFEKMID